LKYNYYFFCEDFGWIHIFLGLLKIDDRSVSKFVLLLSFRVTRVFKKKIVKLVNLVIKDKIEFV